MSIQKEEWRNIPGFDGWYQISDWGRVRTWHATHNWRLKKPKMMKIHNIKNFATILLSKGGRQYIRMGIMHLMAQVWLGGIPPGKRTIHKDGDIRNNSRWNIAIVSEKERAQAISKIKASRIRKSVVVLDDTLTVIDAYPSAAEAGRKTGLSTSSITRRCNLECTSVFAKNGLIYVWDDARSIWAVLRRAMREMDTLGLRYNTPLTGRYFDLPPEDGDELKFDTAALCWDTISDPHWDTSDIT